MFQNKETELRRAEFYKSNLRRIGGLYEPAIKMEKKNPSCSGSMAEEFVLAPFLLLFTVWVLKSAEKDGIRRLYFLARDGFPAYKMADRLCREYGINIECRYFYCSRYSLRVPMYSENPDEMIEYVCRSGIDVTVRKILTRAGLNQEQAALIEEDALREWHRDDRLSFSQLEEIRSILGNNRLFLSMVRDISEEKWQLLADYFKQEGLTAEEPIGIVDSGWIGSTQKSFSDILKRIGISANINGYYWGLYDLPKEMDPGEYHGFFFGKKHGLRNKVCFSNCLIEAVYSAGHGTTLGYQKQGDRIIPRLQSRWNNAEFLERFNRMLESYTDSFIESCDREAFDSLNVKAAVRILSGSLIRFMKNPTKEEAEFFGSLQFSDDLLDDHSKELAPVFSESELKENRILHRILNAAGFRRRGIHESAWFAATVRRSTPHGRRHNCSYMAYRALSYLKKMI